MDLDAQNAFELQLQREQLRSVILVLLDFGVEEANRKIESCVEDLRLFNILKLATALTANNCPENTCLELLSAPPSPNTSLLHHRCLDWSTFGLEIRN